MLVSSFYLTWCGGPRFTRYHSLKTVSDDVFAGLVSVVSWWSSVLIWSYIILSIKERVIETVLVKYFYISNSLLLTNRHYVVIKHSKYDYVSLKLIWIVIRLDKFII